MHNLYKWSRDNVIVVYAGMTMNAVGFFCCSLSFFSTCKTDREFSIRRQCFINPWIISNFSMVSANYVYIAWAFYVNDYSYFSEVTGALLVLNPFYHIIMCTSWGVLYTIFKWNVSNDIMIMLSYTKPPRHEQVARNDGYVLMKYIPNSDDPLSYSKNRDDDQWIIISYTDWQLFCNSLW